MGQGIRKMLGQIVLEASASRRGWRFAFNLTAQVVRVVKPGGREIFTNGFADVTQ